MTITTCRTVDTDSADETVVLSELLTLLARCFKRPDEQTATALSSDRLAEEIVSRGTSSGLIIEMPAPPDRPHQLYRRTFEAYDEGPYAPPAESVYKDWWDGTRRELLAGPPAHDMAARYEAVGMEIPPAYPADHIALLLEYSSLLLEERAFDEYLAFDEAHFDWIPQFRARVERTSEVEFHHWAVAVLETVIEQTRSHVETKNGEG